MTMRRNLLSHRRVLAVELLESRRLLSSLSYSLTTDSSTYQVGQPIHMTFTETNNGPRPVKVGIGPSNSGFDVAHDGHVVWMSNGGVQPMYIQLRVLQPGQSITRTATWNGIPSVGPPSELTGTFTVTNQQARTAAHATFTIQPPSPTAAPLTMTNIVTTINTDRAVYLPGRPIHMTFTETNEGSAPVQVVASPSAFEVYQNGSLVWKSDTVPVTTYETLAPGESLTRTATWNGPQPFVATGSGVVTYTVSNELAPDTSTTFKIVGPKPEPLPPPVPPPVAHNSALTAVLTTAQSVYRPRHPVVMTLTLTNTGNTSVAITPNPSVDGFSVSRGNVVVWHSVATAAPEASLSIAPGKSVTLTATWNGKPNQPGATAVGPGTYTLVAAEGAFHASTTIHIGKQIRAMRHIRRA
jgi:hypothetical protein